MTTETEVEYWGKLNQIGERVIAAFGEFGLLSEQNDAIVTDKMAANGFALIDTRYRRYGEHFTLQDNNIYTLAYAHPSLPKFEIRVDSGKTKNEIVTTVRTGRFDTYNKTITTYDFTGRNVSYYIDKQSWLGARFDDAKPYLIVAGTIAASVFGGPAGAFAAKTATAMDAGTKIDSAIGNAAQSVAISQIPGVIDSVLFTDTAIAVDDSAFNISSPSFDSSALTNPALDNSYLSDTLTMPVSAPSLDINVLPPLGTTAMNDFADFDLTPDTYSGFVDNVDFSWGEGAPAVSDAQNVSFGFSPMIGDGAFPTYGEGAYSQALTGPLPSGEPITLGGTPDTLVSDFGSIRYSNPPANGSLFTASNLKIAENIGKTIVNVANYAKTGGGSKFTYAPAVSGPTDTASGGLSTQKETQVKTVGQLQPGRPVEISIPPMVVVAVGIAGIYFLSKGKK